MIRIITRLSGEVDRYCRENMIRIITRLSGLPSIGTAEKT